MPYSWKQRPVDETPFAVVRGARRSAQSPDCRFCVFAMRAAVMWSAPATGCTDVICRPVSPKPSPRRCGSPWPPPALIAAPDSSAPTAVPRRVHGAALTGRARHSKKTKIPPLSTEPFSTGAAWRQTRGLFARAPCVGVNLDPDCVQPMHGAGLETIQQRQAAGTRFLIIRTNFFRTRETISAQLVIAEGSDVPAPGRPSPRFGSWGIKSDTRQSRYGSENHQHAFCCINADSMAQRLCSRLKSFAKLKLSGAASPFLPLRDQCGLCGFDPFQSKNGA